MERKGQELNIMLVSCPDLEEFRNDICETLSINLAQIIKVSNTLGILGIPYHIVMLSRTQSDSNKTSKQPEIFLPHKTWLEANG